MDEIHVCVLRTLAEDETRSSRAIRVLPLDQMDTVRKFLHTSSVCIRPGYVGSVGYYYYLHCVV